jgi:hypothetical protein
MSDTHRFARLTFAVAGIYGLLTMLPLYGMEARIGRDSPPITHPEYFYGFIGVTVAWQLVFLVVSRAPDRLRPIMPAAVVEKLGFGVPAIVLALQRRIPGVVLGFGLVDLLLGALFLTAYLRTPSGGAARR